MEEMPNTISEDPDASIATFQNINSWNSLLQAAELTIVF